MMLSIINAIKEILKTRFHTMLQNGAFPEVNYRGVDGYGHSFYMMEYSTFWSMFAKVADKYIKEKIDPELGVFTRKHSQKVLSVVKEIVENINEQEVRESATRFKMWAD